MEDLTKTLLEAGLKAKGMTQEEFDSSDVWQKSEFVVVLLEDEGGVVWLTRVPSLEEALAARADYLDRRPLPDNWRYAIFQTF